MIVDFSFSTTCLSVDKGERTAESGKRGLSEKTLGAGLVGFNHAVACSKITFRWLRTPVFGLVD